MLADPSYGQDVRKPPRQDDAVWEVQPELDTRGFGDGSPRHGRMKLLARGSGGLAVLNEELKATAKLHGLLLVLHQDITLAESVAFLSVRQLHASTFPGMVGEVPGSASCIRETQRLERRGAQEYSGSGAHRLGSRWSSNAIREGREPHTQIFRAYTHAGEDGQVLYLLEVRAGARWGRRGPVSSAKHISRVTVVRDRAQVCWSRSVADAVSLIRTSPPKKTSQDL